MASTCRSPALPGRVLSGAPASLRARERAAEQDATWSPVPWCWESVMVDHGGPENGIVHGGKIMENG